MAADRPHDRVRNLTELCRIAARHGGPGVPRAAVETRLRHDADALTYLARLRRGGMSDADVAAALFDAPSAGA